MKPILLLSAAWLMAGCNPAVEPATSSHAAPAAVARPRSTVASPHSTDSDALILEKGKAVVQEAFSILSSNLLAALAAGGPTNAIPFCSVQALPLTEIVSDKYAVEVRRVSHRVRNPGNTPELREESMLEAFQAQVAAGEPLTPVVQREGDAAYFYAPIVLNNPLCLTCHGEPGKDIAAETAALLTKLYPHDQATGFRMNELRGMWVVKIQP